jgi:hypothetical protein
MLEIGNRAREPMFDILESSVDLVMGRVKPVIVNGFETGDQGS